MIVVCVYLIGFVIHAVWYQLNPTNVFSSPWRKVPHSFMSGLIWPIFYIVGAVLTILVLLFDKIFVYKRRLRMINRYMGV